MLPTGTSVKEIVHAVGIADGTGVGDVGGMDVGVAVVMIVAVDVSMEVEVAEGVDWRLVGVGLDVLVGDGPGVGDVKMPWSTYK